MKLPEGMLTATDRAAAFYILTDNLSQRIYCLLCGNWGTLVKTFEVPLVP